MQVLRCLKAEQRPLFFRPQGKKAEEEKEEKAVMKKGEGEGESRRREGPDFKRRGQDWKIKIRK